MRLLICAGGTGGGVYPALTVLQALGNQADPVLWVGGVGGMEADLVTRANIPFKAIPAAGLHGVGLRTLPANLWRLGKGIIASRKILSDFRPDALLFTGGYVAVPMALAGYRVPSLIYIPDIEPGLALTVLVRTVKKIAITNEESFKYLPDQSKAVITGYPTRPDLLKWNRDKGCQTLGLRQDKPILLVSGGSRGARSINRALIKILPQVLERTQVIHISGSLDWPEVELNQKALTPQQLENYRAFPYLHEMGAALAAADLAVSRAGASTLGEYPLFGLPAVLVPYPHAWRYQKVNADYLVKHQAAVQVRDENLTDQLLPTLLSLFDHPEHLVIMQKAMRQLARPNATTKIAEMLCSLSSDTTEERL